MEWVIEGNKLKKVFNFKSFAEAIKFVNIVAEVAEQAAHHPDIMIKYNQVTLELWTHDTGDVQPKDFTLAKKIDEAVKHF